MDQDLVRLIISKVVQKLAACSFLSVNPRPVPIEVSNRFANFTQNAPEILSGPGCTWNVHGEISRPGRYDEEENRRHLRMQPSDAEFYGVADGQTIQVKVGGACGLIFENVPVRVGEGFPLAFHIDTDEANAAGIKNGDQAAYLLLPQILQEFKSGSDPGSESTPAEPKQRPVLEEIPEKLVTEETVRQAWKKKAVLIINKGVLCTPLARDVMKELGVSVIWR